MTNPQATGVSEQGEGVAASQPGHSPKGGAASCTASPAKPSVPNAAWKPIGSAPSQSSVIVGDDGPDNIAIAHEWHGFWFLGRMEDIATEGLDFEPRWWLPLSYPKNPFKLKTPASGIETEGHDAEGRHGAEHESPAPQGDAQGHKP